MQKAYSHRTRRQHAAEGICRPGSSREEGSRFGLTGEPQRCNELQPGRTRLGATAAIRSPPCMPASRPTATADALTSRTSQGLSGVPRACCYTGLAWLQWWKKPCRYQAWLERQGCRSDMRWRLPISHRGDKDGELQSDDDNRPRWVCWDQTHVWHAPMHDDMR